MIGLIRKIILACDPNHDCTGVIPNAKQIKTKKQKALVIRVFLYSESARTYDRKSDDLEICRV